MQRITLLIVVVFGLTHSVFADCLQIVGQNLAWTPNTQPSIQYLLGIEKASETTELLMGWQLTCVILRAPGATGEVFFESVSEPPQYVFEGVCDPSNPISVYENTVDDPFGTEGFVASSGVISGFIGFDQSGVSVPQSGANLVSLELTASEDASGQFDIAILPDIDWSNPPDLPYSGAVWFSDNGTMEEFVGMPFGAGPVVVGRLDITPVAEPASVVLLLWGGLVFLGLRYSSIEQGVYEPKLSCSAGGPCNCPVGQLTSGATTLISLLQIR